MELTNEQIDILGEIGNISMGNAATTLSLMLNQRVDITTPQASIINRSAALDDYEKTCIFVQIHYVKGLAGNNVLILREEDVLKMTSLMMGGDGKNYDPELTDLHLSAASEAMNQMMGTAATSMATMLGTETDISTPEVNRVDVESVKLFEKMFDSEQDKFFKVAFRLEVGDLIDSTMVQLYPISVAKQMVELFQINKKED